MAQIGLREMGYCALPHPISPSYRGIGGDFKRGEVGIMKKIIVWCAGFLIGKLIARWIDQK